MFKRANAFCYIFEDEVEGTIVVKAPDASPNKRGVEDIGFQSDGDDVKLYGTLSSDTDNAIWQEIQSGDEINKTVNAFKIENSGAKCKVVIRIILR